MRHELAVSLAGHDAGRCYYIVERDTECCYLADGVSRKIGNPKKKNEKHLQIVKNIPDGIEQILNQKLSDPVIRRALCEYKKYRDRKQS